MAEALKLVSDGATGIAVWEMNDIYWKKTSYGLIDLDGRLRPAVAAFESFMQQVGRSSSTVTAYGADAGPGLAATAFQVTRAQQSGLVLVLANVTQSAIPVTIAFKNADGTGGLGPQPFRVSSMYPNGKDVALQGVQTALSLIVPAGSVVGLSNVSIN